MKFRDFYNPSPDDYPRESIDTSSIAVPDQSLSVREIIDRSLRGLVDPSQLIRNSVDDINPDIDDESEDMTDIVDIHNNLRYYEEVSRDRRNNRQRDNSGTDGTPAEPTEELNIKSRETDAGFSESS
ncbi:hypothetical protein [Dipodfec virus RodF1_81]|uniref:Uncharacterized protein n=1 Tax=Dipodfec virus RodF1_81 TaxID=2929313 RepID=A0A976N2K2_9VIRU|nr:hypothetical protein [Dipodfec virus RodF1_81]